MSCGVATTKLPDGPSMMMPEGSLVEDCVPNGGA
jgi:hypothetical protein